MTPTQDQIVKLLVEWREDPVRFVEEAFSGDPRNPPPVPEEWQREALQAIAAEDRVAVRSGHGVGKALAVNETVFTPTGRRMIGTLKPGDFVAAPDGTFVRVHGVYPQGMRPLYRVYFDDGTWVTADADHLWVTQTRQEAGRRKAGSVRTTMDLARSLPHPNANPRSPVKRWNHALPDMAPLELPEVPTLRPAYETGLSLDPDAIMPLLGGSVRQRADCLRGMIDAYSASVGSVVKGSRLVFGVSFRHVAPLAAYLCRSLGGWARLDPTQTTLTMARPAAVNVLSSTVVDARKVRPRQVFVTAVEFDRHGEAVCIKVEHPDELFLAGEFKPTHNTTTLAWIILWFALTRNPYKIPCTAPSSATLQSGLWPEIGKWYRRLHPVLRRMLRMTTDRLELNASDTDGVRNSFAEARTARVDNPEALQGFHEDNLLLVIDEASGVPDIIFEVGAGSLSTRGAKQILTGNPTRTSGYFYDAFHPRAGEKPFYKIHVPCWRSSQVDPEWIEEMKAKYGEDSPVYAVRVKGDFPTVDDFSLVPKHLVELAIRRSKDIDFSPGPVFWGLDVARQGSDHSALAKRTPRHVLEPVQSWSSSDLMATVGRVMREFDAAPRHLQPKEILVDVIGLGAGVYDRLREQGLPVVAVNVSERSSEPDRYTSLRDELWFRLVEWLQNTDVTMVDDPALVADLISVQQIIRSSGKVGVESKDAMRKRIQRSPDMADALVLTFAASSRWTRGANPRHTAAVALVRADGAYDPRRW